ncbi:MAG: MFS transporter [Defluviitaleaceae bacterium]|nr:MFS transporter [Defluviitaleaceae bacterium]
MTLSRLQSLYPKGSTRRIMLMFILMNMFGFVVIAGSRGYIVAFLEYVGYSASMIGAVVSVMAGFGILGQFVIGYLCDKFGRIKPFYFMLMVVVLCASFLIYFVQPPVAVMFVAFALLGTSLVTCAQLVDSWVLESGEECKQAYGQARAAGSFGWAVGLFAMGPLIMAFGYAVLPAVSFVFMMMAFTVARGQPDARKPRMGKALTVASVKELFTNYRYVHLLITTFMIFGVVSAEWVLNGIKAAQLATPVMFGVFSGMMGLAEVPFFIIFQRIRQKFNISHIFVFGIFVYIVRITLMGLAPNVGIMTLIALTNAFAYAPCYICAKMLLDEEIPQHLKTTGQLVAAACFAGLAGIIFPPVIGAIADTFGLDAAFFILAAFAVVPFVLALVFLRLKNRKV